MSELVIKNPKFELREGESKKTGRKWSGIGVQVEYDGIEYSGIVFPPRNAFGNGKQMKVETE